MVVIAAALRLAASVRQDMDAPAVDQHGAGAALAVVAALLGAGQAQPLAQHVEQGRGCRHRQAVPSAVDLETDVELLLKEVRHRPPRLSPMASA